MNVYLAGHRPNRPGDPVKALTTVVAPRPLPQAELASAVATHNPDPILDVRHRVLHYPEMPPDPAIALKQVEQFYANCGTCHLSEERTRVVFFRGNPYSPVIAFGEGPGKQEDIQGIPFCGRSGRLQDELFRQSGIDPDHHVGWGNLVGCRPCNNRFAKDRPPTLAEKLACSERTLMVLRAFRPRIVLCLGKQAAQMFWDEEALKKPKESGLHPNTWHTLVPPDDPRDAVVVGYVRHPAGLIRMIQAAGSYKEYISALLFYEELRKRMQSGIEKVAKWRFGLRYLSDLDGSPVVGGRS